MLFIKPMKAIDADLDQLVFPVLALIKLDGVRALSPNGEILARTLKRFKNKALNLKFDNPTMTGADGELCSGDLLGQALCRNTSSVVNSFDKTIENIRWMIFDCISDDVLHLPYIERHAEAVKRWGADVIPYVVVNNREEAEAIIEEHLSKNAEGTIFRNPQGIHKNGRSTQKDGGNYWRVKSFADEECVVISLNEAMENQNEAVENELGHMARSSHQENKVAKGMIGSLNCRSDKWGDFVVGSGEMSHEERKLYWENPVEIVGKVITFKYMTSGIKTKPRFPTFKTIRLNDT